MKFCALAIVLGAAASASASITSLNFDQFAPVGVERGAGPALGAGWVPDQIDAAFTDSVGSSYDFVLAAPAFLRVTDQFIVGDNYQIYDGIPLIGVTSLNGAQASILPIGDPTGDSGWTDGRYQHAEILLGAGPHSIRIQGDGVGGVPAGFYVRLDEVPTPGAAALLGIAGIAAIRRRR